MLHELTQLASSWGVETTESEDAATDEALAARGDAEAFIQLYSRHLRAVYSYLYLRLGDRQEEEDVTSTVFMRAWSSFGRYKPTGAFKGWLFTIAHRALVDHYRGRKSRSVQLDRLVDQLADPEPGPEEKSLASEQALDVLRIMAGLRSQQQEVIALRFMAGLPYSEIARVMKKREAAVKMVAYRALQEIRRRYDDVSK